jgi:hypothetical protein
MGKNMVGKAPHDIVTRMGMTNPESYTFQRTSATSAANRGKTTEQMQSFFGWKNSICQEYISSSRQLSCMRRTRWDPLTWEM